MMLVLARNIGERIIIDGNIELVVVQIRGNRVRLGVRAPREVSIHRGEAPCREQDFSEPASCLSHTTSSAPN